MHTIIYSLRDLNGSPKLDYSLGLKIVFETPKEIQIELPTGTVTLNKYKYLNKDIVYDNGDKIFFLICNKQVKSEYAFKFLLRYASNKLATRISNLQMIKSSWDKLSTTAA